MNDIGIIVLRGKRGGFSLVDAEDFQRLNAFKWRLGFRGYVISTKVDPENPKYWTTLLLHRTVLNLPTLRGYEDMVDHRNTLRIDNRKQNLRPCVRRQNGANRGPSKNGTSGFKGVTFNKKGQRWAAQLGDLGRRYHLGFYDTPVEAALAYNAAALQHFGEFAKLNNVWGE